MNIRLHHSPQHAAAPACDPIPFSFDGTEGRVTGKGPAEPLARGNCDTLEARIGAALPGAAPDTLIGGALPFDRGADDCLWLCRGERTAARPATAAPPLALPDWRLTAEPGAAAYARAVARALDIMQADPAPQRHWKRWFWPAACWSNPPGRFRLTPCCRGWPRMTAPRRFG